MNNHKLRITISKIRSVIQMSRAYICKQEEIDINQNPKSYVTELRELCDAAMAELVRMEKVNDFYQTLGRMFQSYQYFVIDEKSRVNLFSVWKDGHLPARMKVYLPTNCLEAKEFVSFVETAIEAHNL